MRIRDSPFEVGQLVESRSFQAGYRGSWFLSKNGKRKKNLLKMQYGLVEGYIRCDFVLRIKDVSWRKGHLGYILEFPDFPDERKSWTKLYQKPRTYDRNAKQKDLHIMLRPRFPPVYRESQMPDVSAISEVVVIVNDSWKVGDLVDWWQDGCYWSGRIAEVLEDGKYQMDLLPPPLGEGLSYEVCSKDLRPSLDWSLKSGWTVSAPMDSDNGQRCARIVNPANKGNTPSFKTRKASENRDRVQGIAGSSQSSVPSRGSARSPKPSNKLEQMRKLTLGAMAADKEMHTPATDMDLDMPYGGTWESSCSDSDESESSGIIGDETGASVSAFTSHVSSSSEPPDKLEETKKRPLCAMEEKENTQGTKTESDMENDSIGKTICSDNDSNSDVKAGSTDVGEMMLEKDRLDEGGSSKKMKTDVNIPLNLMFSNTIEAAVLDLEELVNRVKWMKSLLEIATSSSNTTRPPWKFLGHLPSSAPK